MNFYRYDESVPRLDGRDAKDEDTDLIILIFLGCTLMSEYGVTTRLSEVKWINECF